MKIAYTATRNFYSLMQPTIRSLLEHNQPDMIYFLIEDDELPFDVPAPHTVLNVSGQTIFTGGNTNSYFTYMTLMRLALGILTDADRIIYIDVDTIICDSLEPLAKMDMTGKWWGAVEEVYGSWHPFGPHYFNAGVSVFNLKQMREDGAIETMIKDVNSKVYRFPDQDILNKYCVPERVISIHPRYNESFCCGMTNNPAIVHFAGYPDWFENRKLFRQELVEKYKNIPPSSEN